MNYSNLVKYVCLICSMPLFNVSYTPSLTVKTELDYCIACRVCAWPDKPSVSSSTLHIYMD